MVKIIGNTTATPNPRPDWAQTDENKADFIKNKNIVEDNIDTIEEDIGTIEDNIDEIEADVSTLQQTTDELRGDLDTLKQALSPGFYVTTKTTDTYNFRETASGLPFVDESWAKIERIEGNTISTRNLIPYPYTFSQKTTKGITFTANSNGSVAINGTKEEGTETDYIYYNLHSSLNLIAGVTYSIKLHGATTGVWLEIAYLNNEGREQYATKTFTFQKEYTITRISIVISSDVTRINNLIVNPMVNKGETILPYEPYFKGLKSTVLYGIRSTGKNLFDSGKLLVANWKVDTDGVYYGLVRELWGNYNSSLGGFLTINADERVTVSFEGKNASILMNSLLIGFVYTDGSTDSRVSINTTEFQKYSITSAENKKVTSIYFTYNHSDNIYLKDFCVKFGTDDTYEPYVKDTLELPESIELGKWDYIENGKVIKGTEIKEFVGKEGGWFLYKKNTFAIDLSDKEIGLNKTVCNLYNYKAYAWDTAGAGYYSDHPTSSHIYFNASVDIDSLDKWKQYLIDLNEAGNPLTVAYKLATPTPFTETVGEGEEAEEVEVTTTINDEFYTAYNNGSEVVISPDAYSPEPTITQEYIRYIEV